VWVCVGRQVHGASVRSNPFGSRGGPWSRASSPLLEDCLLSARIDREFQLIFSATRDKATNDTYIFLRIDMCMFD
jgi:hypothetical protein